MCKSAVRDATYEMLENLTLSSTQGPLISEWSKFYTVFEQEPLKQLVSESELKAFVHHGFWQCMDTLREKQHLEKLWSTGNAPWKIWK